MNIYTTTLQIQYTCDPLNVFTYILALFIFLFKQFRYKKQLFWKEILLKVQSCLTTRSSDKARTVTFQFTLNIESFQLSIAENYVKQAIDLPT